ncbi:unnamed protein product, partial [Hymenolepis diminuta]
MPPSSTEAKGESTESQERLALLRDIGDGERICILNPECTEVEIEHQWPVDGEVSVVAFQNKLVFFGIHSRRVDLMDLSTGQVSSLPDMKTARSLPVC